MTVFAQRLCAPQIAEKMGGPPDLVTSDLAPKLSGMREYDQALALELLMTALEFARARLRPGGAMVAKVLVAPRRPGTARSRST